MHSPFVSVIVPVYNDSEQLSTCLRALSDQTYPPDLYEVIVVDNGSEEDLRSIVARFPGFRYEYEDRVGSYAARNKGIEASKGEILAFTDSDCLPEAGWIEAGIEALEASPGVGAVGGRIQMFARDESRVTAFDLHDLVWGMPQRLYIERFGLAATGNLFARREVFERVGSFDPEFRSCGDCEWCFRMTASGVGLGYAPDARVLHPTRSSMASFVRRRRRITGGYHLLDPLIERLYPSSEFEIPRSFFSSIRRIRRSFGHRRLDTAGRKAQFALAELLLYAVTTLEAWRLRFGGEPRRG
jgi:GT2 family glycosyltransferase